MPVSRAFVAIRVSAELGKLSDAMRPLWPAQGVSWVRPENLHLTLRFLGAAEDAQIAALREGLTAVAVQHEAFTATIEQSGCFPIAADRKLFGPVWQMRTDGWARCNGMLKKWYALLVGSRKNGTFART